MKYAVGQCSCDTCLGRGQAEKLHQQCFRRAATAFRGGEKQREGGRIWRVGFPGGQGAGQRGHCAGTGHAMELDADHLVFAGLCRGKRLGHGATKGAARRLVQGVLSDGFELVSPWTVTLPFMRRRVDATLREQRLGSV